MSTEKSYIDDLLNSLEKPLPKVAGEIPPQFLKKDKDEAEDKGDKKEEKKDQKEGGKDDKKDEKKDEKSASDLDLAFADLSPEIKAACTLEAQTRLMADLKQRELLQPKQASTATGMSEADIESIYNFAHHAQSEKIAMFDPWYAGVLAEEVAKEAFDLGYADQLAELVQSVSP